MLTNFLMHYFGSIDHHYFDFDPNLRGELFITYREFESRPDIHHTQICHNHSKFEMDQNYPFREGHLVKLRSLKRFKF